MAQDNSEKASLTYKGFSTVNDIAIFSEADTLVKVGTFANNLVAGELFFGYSESQLGFSGHYSHGSILNSQSFSLSREDYSLGLIFRQSLGMSEIKLGCAYYKRKQEEKTFGSDQEVKSQGISVPAELIVTQETTRILPKLNVAARQQFSFTDQFSKRYLDREDFSLSADLSLYRVDLLKEFYISPTVGYERGEMMGNNKAGLFKIGGVVSSYLIRADVISFGYFFEKEIAGVEGFYFSLNLVGLFH